MYRLAHWIGLGVVLFASNGVRASDRTDAVYRLRIVSTDCQRQSCQVTTAYASAVAIGHYNPGKEILVTAAHAVRGNPQKMELDVDGEWIPAVLLGLASGGHDLALIGTTAGDRQLNTVALTTTTLATNETVTLAGFPGGGELHRRSGRVMRSQFGSQILSIATPSRPGDSGGGVFNDQDELAAVIFATAPVRHPTYTLATDANAIRELIRTTFQADPPKVRLARLPPTPKSTLKPSATCRCQQYFAQIETLTKRVQTLEAELNNLRAEPPEISARDLLPLEQRLRRIEDIQIPVQVLTPDGKVQAEAKYRLGEPIQLRLIPRGN